MTRESPDWGTRDDRHHRRGRCALAYFGVLEGEEQGSAGPLVLGLVFLAFGVPALVLRIRDILS